MKVKEVGIAGTGAMGYSVARLCAEYDYLVRLWGRRQTSLSAALERVRNSLIKGGKDDRKVLSRIKATTTLEDLAGCDLIIENIIEDLGEKKKLFSRLGELTPEAILASNTSSIPIIELAMAARNPERVVGLHFFNPAYAMKLAEVVKTIVSREDVVEAARAFALSLERHPIVIKDRPGFLSNRIFAAYLLEAVRALDEGVASREDIDAVMTLSTGWAFGPLATLDYVGVDVIYQVALNIYQETKDPRFAPPPLMKQMVTAGHWGRKRGRGFYDYTPKA